MGIVRIDCLILKMCMLILVFIVLPTYAQVISIDSIEELQLIGNDPAYPRNGSYVLSQDIDASATSGWDGGRGFQPIGDYEKPFCGILDGQGHRVIGLYINRPDESYVGIFKYIATNIIPRGVDNPPEFYVGKVKNIIIENATVVGNTNVGCLAGSAQRIGSTTQPGYTERHLIENVQVINSRVSGVSYIGGVVGNIREGTLQDCFVRDTLVFGSDVVGGLVGSVSAYVKRCCSTGVVYGEGSQIGGLSGNANFFSYSAISQCFSTSWTFGKNYVGGLIGRNFTVTTECYSAGLVYGKTFVGGLVGEGDLSKIQNCFFDVEATKQSNSVGGEPLATEQMLVPDVFQSAGWDYTSVWTQSNGITRPYLQSFPPSEEELELTVVTEGGGVNVQPGPPHSLWSVVRLVPEPETGYRLAGYELYYGTDKSFIVPIETDIVWTVSHSTSMLIKFLPDQSIYIDDISDLQKIGNDINFPLFWSYIITSDIDASESSGWNGGKGFSPIGTSVFWFSGKIIGGGHTISNLFINRPDEQGVAVFKYVDQSAEISDLNFSGANVVGEIGSAILAYENWGEIRNVALGGCVVSGYSHVGGLVTRNVGSLTTCSITGNSEVSSTTDYAGGICAFNDPGGVIYLSNVDANVSGGSYIGGLVAVNIGVIRKSYSTGSVSSSVSYVGGLVGTNQGTIFRCYSHSNVNCVEYGGGLVGINLANVEETYSTGSVTENSPNSGGLIGYNMGNVLRSFWDIETSNYTTSAGGTGKTTAEMLERATFEAEGWDFELVWANDDNTLYPYLRETTIVPAVFALTLEEAENLIISALLVVGEVTHQCSDTVPFGDVISSEPLPGSEVPLGYSVNLVVSDGPCPPSTKIISSIEELQKIGYYPDYPLDGFYELSQDIDATNTYSWSGGQGFSPIGQGSQFTGYFDGKGFKIINLTIKRPYTDNIALFAKISGNAIVKNLILEGVSISGSNNVGGLVGECEGGVISNVSVSGTLLGRGNLGGIAGLNQNGTISRCSTDVSLINSRYNSNTGGVVGQNQNIITYCSAVVNANITNTPNGAGGIAGVNGGFVSYCIGMGSIRGSDNCGGLVGNNGWSISKCWANVDLEGLNYIGGLVGKNTGGSVSNCFATGRVRASFYSGGLIGGLSGGTVENCYSIGRVFGVSGYIGGLIGYEFGGETINSFWNVITSLIDTSFGGIGKTTSEMLDIGTYSSVGWDFTNVWYMPEGKLLSYPQLRGLAPIEYVAIPRIIGLTQADANATLSGLGLISGTITTQCNTAYPAGTVFEQVPGEGNVVAELYPIDMKVSTGPCLTIVPDLIGLTFEQAEIQLANANLVLGNITYRCTDQYAEGTIFEQIPSGGTQMPETSSVDVTISQGPCMTIVPYVVGLSQVSAEYQINTVELAVSVIAECNNEVGAGIVFAQEPEGGSQVITGTVVTIYVSTGLCPEGVIEGEGVPVEGEGVIEGEGVPVEGEGLREGEMVTHHSADSNGDGKIGLNELLRVIQFFNIGGYYCSEGTEDGYAPGIGNDYSCQPHSSDYNPQDWKINIEELLRLIQIYNVGHYYPCPGGSEDGFCF